MVLLRPWIHLYLPPAFIVIWFNIELLEPIQVEILSLARKDHYKCPSPFLPPSNTSSTQKPACLSNWIYEKFPELPLGHTLFVQLGWRTSLELPNWYSPEASTPSFSLGWYILLTHPCQGSSLFRLAVLAHLKSSDTQKHLQTWSLSGWGERGTSSISVTQIRG